MNTISHPLISVLMLTYNHKPYIAQAIESVLAQKTDYTFELIICDDASTDGTQAIAKEYAEKDSRIVLSLQPNNTKFGKNFADGCALIRGKYVAFCEGDDYWTSPEKLQTQVGFLENNPDFSVCAHKVQIFDQVSRQPDDKPKFVYKDCSADEQRIKDGVFYADEAIANYYFQTGSLVLRWRFTNGLPQWFRKRMMFDHFLFMLHAVEGKIKYFDTPMSVWRRHGGGYTWLQTRDKGLFFQKEGYDWIKLYQMMDEFFSYRFTWQIRERILLAIRSIAANCLETGNFDHIRHLVNKYPQYFNSVLNNSVLYDSLRLAFPDNPEFVPPWESVGNCNSRPDLSYLPDTVNADFNDAKKNKPSTIGGFFELAIDDIPEINNSVWNAWTANREFARFFNLRSALLRFLWQRGVSTIWLPAYCPPLLEEDRFKCQITRKFYHITHELNPPDDFLKNVQPGEAVITIRYLGRPLPADFCMALAEREDIIWVEDLAQCLSPANDTCADAVIYSPRMVLGVPDGGLIVGNGVHELETWLENSVNAILSQRMEMMLRKYEAFDDFDVSSTNLRWKKTDMEHHLSRWRMSTETEAFLKRIPLDHVGQKRKANWSVLYSRLSDYCLWKISEPDFIPYAFPLFLPNNYPAEIMHTLLARRNIICQRMWHPLSAEKNMFPIEENLASRLLLLPCDQRYGKEDMRRIAELVRDIFKRPESFTNSEANINF